MIVVHSVVLVLLKRVNMRIAIVAAVGKLDISNVAQQGAVNFIVIVIIVMVRRL